LGTPVPSQPTTIVLRRASRESRREPIRQQRHKGIRKKNVSLFDLLDKGSEGDPCGVLGTVAETSSTGSYGGTCQQTPGIPYLPWEKRAATVQKGVLVPKI